MATAETTDNGSINLPEPDPQPETATTESPTTESEAPPTIGSENTEHTTETDSALPQSTGPDAAAVPEEKKWPGWPGHCVFRMIVPVLKVGSIIGRKGELIKKTCEDTRARIKVLDGPVSSPDRIVRFYLICLKSFCVRNLLVFSVFNFESMVGKVLNLILGADIGEGRARGACITCNGCCSKSI